MRRRVEMKIEMESEKVTRQKQSRRYKAGDINDRET
jgi:hypothetical protein